MLLSIRGLRVEKGGKEIISNLNLDLEEGESVAILGANGSGKTTFAEAIAGYPSLHCDGKISFLGEDIKEQSLEERAKKGIFLAYQFPPKLPGIKVYSYLKRISPEVSYQAFENLLKILSLKPTILERFFNEGFSGGEKKKLEFLQYLILKPKLAIFDEIDSGMDQKNIKLLVEIVKNKPSFQSIIWITHNHSILKEIPFRKFYVLKNGLLKEISPISYAY